MKFTHNGTEYELMVLHLAGSKLYGNSRPESDTDYRGVFLAPNETFTGLLGTVEQLEGKDVWQALVDAGLDLVETDDLVIYELNRFCKLALDNNPNIMDTLCHDYTNPEFSVYCSDSGKELLQNKHLFMSTKLKHTFSGYAMAQLKRIKGHNKWINEFPDTDKVLDWIKYNYEQDRIDFNWICDNFGGDVAEKVTGETAQNNVSLKDCMTWEEFVSDRAELCNDSTLVEKYRLPQLLDYCHPKDLKAKPLKLDDLVYIDGEPLVVDGGSVTLGHFLNTYASFRTMSPSMLTVYTDGNGLFSKEGNLKANDPETVGEFVCLLSVDQNKYKSDKDHIKKMWQWKCNRNEKRGKDEELYGVDLKHLSHLWRLMTKAKEILTTGTYDPTFKGDDLEMLKGIRDGSLWGKKSYEEGLKFAEKIDLELNNYYDNSPLRKKPDVKAVNKLVLKLRKS